MPWRQPSSIAFTPIAIASEVPSLSGVYAIGDRGFYFFVGEAWNLKGRLLELVGQLRDVGHLTITFELCAEPELEKRKAEISAELFSRRELSGNPKLPGLMHTPPFERYT